VSFALWRIAYAYKEMSEIGDHDDRRSGSLDIILGVGREGNRMSNEKHNYIVNKLFNELIRESESESACMVMLESITLGVMLYYKRDPLSAGEFLDMMTSQVIERMK
jgi:hypothetical protein